MHNSRAIAAGSAPALIPIVIRFGRLGDMVLLSPLLNLLHCRYRNPCWLIGSVPWSALLRCVKQNLQQAQIVLCGSRQELPLLHSIRLAAGLDEVVGLYLPLRRLLALCEVAHFLISVHAVFDAWRSLPLRSAVFTVGQMSMDSDFKGKLC